MQERSEQINKKRKPQKYKCSICGKLIAIYKTPEMSLYGFSLSEQILDKNNKKEKCDGLYCPDCWNLKKLKE
jgi:hypothetical protein